MRDAESARAEGQKIARIVAKKVDWLLRKFSRPGTLEEVGIEFEELK